MPLRCFLVSTQALWLLLPACGAALWSAPPRPPQVLLWIRAGNLLPAELNLDPKVAPKLRDLAFDGVLAAEVDLATIPRTADPQTISRAILSDAVRDLVETRRGGRVLEISSGTAQDSATTGSARWRDRTGGAWSHPVVKLLGKRFGVPPSPSETERAAVARLRAVLSGESAQSTTGGAKRASPRGEAPIDAPASNAALRLVAEARQALEEEAPFVVLLESVAAETAPAQRDEAMGAASRFAREAGILLLVLSVSADAAPSVSGAAPAPVRATLVAAGGGLRRARVIAKPVSALAVAATALEAFGLTPPDGVAGHSLGLSEK